MAEDGKIIYKVEVDDSNTTSEAEKAGKKAGDAVAKGAESGGNAFQEVFTGAARKVGEAFVDMAAQAGSAVTGFVSDSISVGSQFETAMSQVSATLGLSADEIANNVGGAADTFDILRDKAQEMGAATKFTATEAAEGLNILAMSGYDATSSVDMIEDVLHLAAAGSMDMANAAGYISGAMKGFNDDSKDSEYYADLMAKGATLAATSVSQLGDALSGSAATAASYGQTADSTTIALLRLAEQGETGSNAATMLSAAMKNLYAPTDQAKKLMQELGVNAFDPVTHEARDFNEIVDELNGVLGNFSDEERTAYAQTIFGIQGFNAYNKMVVTTTSKQKEWSKALNESAGEAAAQYDTMTDNLQGDLDILNSTMDAFKLSIFDALQPTMREAAQFGTEAVSEITTAFQEDGVSGAIDAALNIVESLFQQFMDAAPGLIDTAFVMIGNFVEGMIESIPNVIQTAVELITMLLTSFVEHLPDLLLMGIELLAALAHGIADAIPQLIALVPTLITSLVTGLIEHLPELLLAGADLLLTILSGIVSAIPQLLAAIPDLIQQLIDVFNNTDWGAIGVQLVEGVWAGIQSMWDGLVANVTGAFDGLVGGVQKLLGIASPSKKFKWIFEMVTEGAIEGMDEGEGDLRRTVDRIYSGVPDIAQNALGSGMIGREDIERNLSFNMSATGRLPDTTIEVPLYLDGREVARATAFQMGEQMAWEEM